MKKRRTISKQLLEDIYTSMRTIDAAVKLKISVPTLLRLLISAGIPLKGRAHKGGMRLRYEVV